MALNRNSIPPSDQHNSGERKRSRKYKDKTRAGRLFMFLFSIPFAAAGVAFLIFLVYPDFRDWISAQSWRPVEGHVLSANLQTNTSSDSTTYEAVGQYRYYYGGNEFTGSRVALSSGADNIGSFHHDVVAELTQALRDGRTITVYVNPENPSQSIYNRDQRWGLFSLKLVFAVVFAGAGFGIMALAIRKPQAVAANDENIHPAEPWLHNKVWASPVIRSSARQTVYAMWFFAAFWNLVTLPIASQIPEELDKGDWGILFVLIFNVIGIVLIGVAIRKTMEWRRFGPTPLSMDPHPGSIGGHVGGTIEVKLRYDPKNQFYVTLSNIRSYVTGSGKNRSRHESVKWQDTGLAKVEPVIGGSKLMFRFDVPEGLHASEKHSSDYYKWNLDVAADLPGVNLNRRYEIPVFPTKASSKSISDTFTNSANGSITADINSPARIKEYPGGLELYYPMGRAKFMSIGLLLFGIIFSGAGVFLGYEYLSERSDFMLMVMALIFFLVGFLIVLGGIYTYINSLWVKLDSMGVSTKRCLFGIAVSTHGAMREEISRLETSRGSQSGTTVYYNIFVKTRDGRSIKVGESFVGSSAANRMRDKMQQLLGL